MSESKPTNTFCRRTRREFLWEAGAGFTAAALTGLLSADGFFTSLAPYRHRPNERNAGVHL